VREVWRAKIKRPSQLACTKSKFAITWKKSSRIFPWTECRRSPTRFSLALGMAEIESEIHSITSGNRAADLFPLFRGWLSVKLSIELAD
jgi:hypothetical protein